jgi:hypothetical protein
MSGTKFCMEQLQKSKTYEAKILTYRNVRNQSNIRRIQSSAAGPMSGLPLSSRFAQGAEAKHDNMHWSVISTKTFTCL